MKSKKHRISRKEKKRKKTNLIRLTNKDLNSYGRRSLTTKEKKSLKLEWRIMLGVVYPKYVWKK